MPKTKADLTPQDALRFALMSDADLANIKTYDLSRAAAFLAERAAYLAKEVNERVKIGAYV